MSSIWEEMEVLCFYFLLIKAIHTHEPIQPKHNYASLLWSGDGIWKRGFCSGPSAKSSGHYNDVIMGTIASQITSLTIVYSIVYSDADQRKHQSSASLAFVRWIHRGTGEFLPQMASYAENVSIWWRHHGVDICIKWFLFGQYDMSPGGHSCFIALHFIVWPVDITVKPVYNDHLMGYFSAFWSSSRWPRAT